MKNFKLDLSLYTLIVISLILFYFRSIFNFHTVLSWDVFGYYLYLPCLFIKGDLGLHDFSYIQHILDTYKPTEAFYQAYQDTEGHWIMKYLCGFSVLNLPFFFIGHLFAKLYNYPLDGFSLPYQTSIAFGSVVYSVIGLFYTRRVLKQYFDEITTSITLIIVVLGTNYFLTSTESGVMPHNYAFTLYAIILWQTIKWHQTKSKVRLFFIGLLIGINTLVRPSDAIIILIPMLWGVYDKQGLKERFNYFLKNYRETALLIVGILSVISIQCLYWYLYTGKFIVYSYADPGEGFEFLSPFILKNLFSFRKGWLIYTPVMIFGIAGIFLIKKHIKENYALMVFLAINFYIISSWSVWWYASSYGHRAMVDSYSIMALPLAACIQELRNKKLVFRIGSAILILFFVMLNLFQSWQITHEIIHPDLMTASYYFKIFGKTTATADDKKLLQYDRYKMLSVTEAIPNADNYTARTIHENNFENETGSKDLISNKQAHSAKK